MYTYMTCFDKLPIGKPLYDPPTAAGYAILSANHLSASLYGHSVTE
jgi:hypothetical protein